MSQAQPFTERTRVQRASHRGIYDRQEICRILDAGIIAHVGMVDHGQPFVLPMIYGRIDQKLYLHGSKDSRLMRMVTSGAVSITVTIVDGLVLARSAFHHSMNYRSVVVLAQGTLVEDRQEKWNALKAISEHVLLGRWEEVRPPNREEMERTSVVSFSIQEASVKIRSGPPLDDEADYGRNVWAGVVPYALKELTPIADPRMDPALPLSPSVERLLLPKS